MKSKTPRDRHLITADAYRADALATKAMVVALSIPDPAPVTRATFPSSRLLISLSYDYTFFFNYFA